MERERLQEEWRIIAGLLPSGWQDLARSEGALRRARGINGPESLLRVILLHAGGGLSLRSTVERARQWRIAEISDVALFKRLRGAEAWLRAINISLLQGSRFGSCLKGVSGKRRLRAIDATSIMEPGATGTDFRVHYSLLLPALYCDFFEITDDKGAESYKRFPVVAGDVLLADRGYCHREGVADVVQRGADVILRLSSTSFPLLDSQKKPLEMLTVLRKLKDHEPGEWPVLFVAGNKRYQARMCAIRKSTVAAEKCKQAILRKAKKHQKKPRPETLEMAEYVVILTTLGVDGFPTSQILDLYRCRWQIELAFKRLKSLLQLGHVPKYDEESSRAWIQAKLLTVLLIERLQQEARFFSPWGFPLSPSQPLA